MLDRTEQRLGNYVLKSLLGQGGFADVYLGEHVYLKRLVAVKVLQMRMTQMELQEFVQEAQMSEMRLVVVHQFPSPRTPARGVPAMDGRTVVGIL